MAFTPKSFGKQIAAKNKNRAFKKSASDPQLSHFKTDGFLRKKSLTIYKSFKMEIYFYILKNSLWFKKNTKIYFYSYKSIPVIISIFFILALIKPYNILAQDTSNLPQKWSLQNCFDYAKNNNIQLQILRKDVDISQQNLLLSKAAVAPNLSANLTQAFTNSKNANPVVGGFQTQSSFAGNYGLNSAMTLYQGGYLKNNIQYQRLGITAANLNVQQAENDMTVQITQDYLNILLDKESIIAFGNVVQTSQAQYDNGKILFDAGSIAKKDLVQLEATLASDKYNLVNAQNQLRQNTLLLKQILQLPSSYNFQVQEPDSIRLPSGITDLATAQDSAFNQRPEIKNSQVALQQAEIQLKQSYAGAKPTLSAGASLASGYSNDENIKFPTQLNNNFYQRIGLTLGIPIFSNRINKTNIEKSKIAIDQSKLSFKSTSLVLSQEVEQAYINTLNAQSQYDAAREQFNANEENYRIANEELKLGAVNMVDFLVQKNLYIQAQQSLIQSKYNVILNYGIYEFYTGRAITL